MKTNIFLITSCIAIAFFATAFTFSNPPKPWIVPDKYLKMSNPVKSDAKSIASAKLLWVKNCQDCHGKKGIGDGSKAPDLKAQPADLSSSAIQSQSDGALFFKISEGRDEMPKFKKEITDPDEIWSIVNYVRTLKK